MKDQELVSALRYLCPGNFTCARCEYEPVCHGDGCAIIQKAADRIANQNTHILALQKEIEGLRSQNEQLRLDRDYAMSIIADVIKDGKTWMCQYCAHCKGTVSGMADCNAQKPCIMPYSQFELKRPEPPEVENAETK